MIATFKADETQLRALAAALVLLRGKGKMINQAALIMTQPGMRDSFSAFMPAIDLSRWDVEICYSLHFTDCYTLDVSSDSAEVLTCFETLEITSYTLNTPKLMDFLKSHKDASGSWVRWDDYTSALDAIATKHNWKRESTWLQRMPSLNHDK